MSHLKKTEDYTNHGAVNSPLATGLIVNDFSLGSTTLAFMRLPWRDAFLTGFSVALPASSCRHHFLQKLLYFYFIVNTIKSMITWDETKRATNLAKHGIDLADTESAFDAPMLTIEDNRMAYGEQRLKSLAWLNGRVVVLLWTERDSDAHVFSCRHADKNQTREYFDALPN